MNIVSNIVSRIFLFFKKIAFSDNFLRFSVVRKVFYTFLHHKRLFTKKGPDKEPGDPPDDFYPLF